MKYVLILKEMVGAAPAEFQVLPEGRIDLAGMPPAFLDEAGARQIIAGFEARGNDMVVDYEHQTLDDGQAPAAGWIKRFVWKGKEGLWAAVEWTQRAREYLENKEYRYFSPVLLAGKEDGRIVALVNVALTNSPAISNLKPLVAKYEIQGAGARNKDKGENIMIEKLKKLLKSGAEATEDQLVQAVEAIIAKNTTLESEKLAVVACKDVIEALGAKEGAGKEEVLRIVASLKAPGDVAVQLSQQVAALTAKITAMEQQDLVALALKEGKTSPEELDKWGRDLALKNPEQFRIIVLSRPAGSVIPVGGLGSEPKDRGAGGLDEAQRKINAMCGVSDETFTKYQK